MKTANSQNNSNKKCNLSKYKKQKMACPVEGYKKDCFFIPASDIDTSKSNPNRVTTLANKANKMMEDLITDPVGQVDPGCVEWNSKLGKFELVYGWHRLWASLEADIKNLLIKNHVAGPAGIWAWVFTGSSAEKIRLQMKENGNKKTQTPASKDDIVKSLQKYINAGGLDTNYSTPFKSLTDEGKYDRARNFMKKEVPYWGGRKFKGVWNQLKQNGNPSLGLSFKSWSKIKMAEYWCQNNPYGITMADLDKEPSGSIVIKGNIKYAVYFVASRSEIAGALPTNASKCMHKNKVNKLIIVGALNDSKAKDITKHRKVFEQQATDWNVIVKCPAFHEVHWLPQTKKEINTFVKNKACVKISQV